MNLPRTSQLALWFLLSSTVKTSLLLGAGGWRSIPPAPPFCHYVWALGIASSIALPLLALLLPSWHSATLGNAARFLGPAHAAAKNSDAAVASPLSGQVFKLILLFWGLGALLVVANLLGGLARLAWISGRSTPVVSGDWGQTVRRICGQLGIARVVQVLECANTASMPLTWGMLRPVLCYPRVRRDGPQSGGKSCYPMNSRTSPVVIGSCNFARNSPAVCTGSIRSRGSQPQVCGERVNGPATIPS